MSLTNVDLERVSEADLEALRENQVTEGILIDYKRDRRSLPIELVALRKLCALVDALDRRAHASAMCGTRPCDCALT
jgi:hypothetical protein